MYITWNVCVWGLENRRFLKKILSKEAPMQAAEEWWKKYLQTLILNLWCNCATTLALTYMASCTLSQNKNFLLRFSSFCGANIADEKNQPPPPLFDILECLSYFCHCEFSSYYMFQRKEAGSPTNWTIILAAIK